MTGLWLGQPRFQSTVVNGRLALARRRVTVLEQIDGAVRLLYGGRKLARKEVAQRPGPAASPAPGSTGLGRIGIKLAASYPWRGKLVSPPQRMKLSRLHP
jgi:hypothetical protein